jgi:dTDP-4-amino-4,6-dideoxygalactose transaminase
MTGQEFDNISKCHALGTLAGDGTFTKKCQDWLEQKTGSDRALLTHSCTAALEMAALLLDLRPGDEVIMPAYTFVSTANAFTLRGCVPVFVDIRPDTLNLDETLIEEAITERTRAIVPVHYAGVSCEMDSILEIALRHGLAVVEDAAQGIMSTYKSRALGALGTLGAYSFHETKNVISGEGGSLMVNDQHYVTAAEIIREKGTNRSQFFRGEVDKYTWHLTGSSYLPGEIIAAFLWAQLNHAREITEQRLRLWNAYHNALAQIEEKGLLRRPVVPEECEHNAHMYYILVPQHVDRSRVIAALKDCGIGAVFHYVPLHSSPAGIKLGRAHGDLTQTEALHSQLIRLPLWIGLTVSQQDHVVSSLERILTSERDKR